MLTHTQQHLEIFIDCPKCGKAFQNAVSLRKHKKKIHAIQIVEVEDDYVSTHLSFPYTVVFVLIELYSIQLYS